MTDEQRKAYLKQAWNLLRAVRNSFPNTRSECPHCGAERFEEWNEHQLREQLNGAITRIERVRDRVGLKMGTKPTKGQRHYRQMEHGEGEGK
jgi:hypothetical protein